jgi:hypothetical protein
MPQTIFKLIGDDESSSGKLRTLIEEALKNGKDSNPVGCTGPIEMTMNHASAMGSGGTGSDKFPRIQVLLKKNSMNLRPTSPLFMGKSPSDGRSSNLDETKTNIDKNAAIQKDIFESK